MNQELRFGFMGSLKGCLWWQLKNEEWWKMIDIDKEWSGTIGVAMPVQCQCRASHCQLKALMWQWFHGGWLWAAGKGIKGHIKQEERERERERGKWDRVKQLCFFSVNLFSLFLYFIFYFSYFFYLSFPLYITFSTQTSPQFSSLVVSTHLFFLHIL